MAYQNVGQCRFYVSILQYLKSLGMVSYGESSDWTTSGDASSLLDINPSSTITFTPTAGNTGNNNSISYQTDVPLGTIMPTEKNFFMVLGHNFASATVSRLVVRDNGGAEVCTDEVVNEISGGVYDGFSIMVGNDAGDISDDFLVFSLYGASNVYATDIKIGSLLYGTYYDMPHSPNLSLTMSREYGGIKEFTTHNGSSMSNTMWSKPPKWGDLGAWELSNEYLSPTHRGNPALTKSGRRTWDLKFSYMDDGNLWGSNQSLSFDSPNTAEQNINIGYESGDMANLVANATTFKYNLLTDDNFFSQVWHKTLSGTLPFIFQPDALVLNETTGLYEGGNNNPDMFAICKFKDNSLKATQSAFNVYDISLSIEEVW